MKQFADFSPPPPPARLREARETKAELDRLKLDLEDAKQEIAEAQTRARDIRREIDALRKRNASGELKGPLYCSWCSRKVSLLDTVCEGCGEVLDEEAVS